MVNSPLRCHLLIGPPASGKSTLAAALAQLVGGQVIATDDIRAELYSDDAVQGAWAEVEAVLHQRLRAAVAEGVPVIVDATHCQRPFRLALTQALELPAPVQWIGWWLTTPLEQCLEWNRQRLRQVDPAVIERMYNQLPSAVFTPTNSFLMKLSEKTPDPVQQAEKLQAAAKIFLDRQRSFLREEGFAYVGTLDPSKITDLSPHCFQALEELEQSIRNALNRHHKLHRHRYSRLLDFERLIYLIKLLLEFPGMDIGRQADQNLTGIEPGEDAEAQALKASFRFAPGDPLPPVDAPFAKRAAFALAHRHGACYGDTNAVADDLDWLQQQGFVSPETVTAAIEPGLATQPTCDAHEVGAGFPAQADLPVFRRQLSLLRYLIQNPFDRPVSLADWDREFTGRKVQPRGRRRFIDGMAAASGSSPRKGEAVFKETAKGTLRTPTVRQHLLERLEAIAGVDYGGQMRRLDKDIELLITPYGFRDPLPMTETPDIPTSSRGNRRGFGLGTALLTVTQLKEVHSLIKQSYNRLNDPTLLALQQELEERLSWGGIAVDSILPVRAFANRSIIDPSQLDPRTMAHPNQLEKVEEAILQQRKIRYRGPSPDGIDKEFVVWPLQIVFHNIAWYLAFESDEVGRNSELLTVARLDRMQLLDILPQKRTVEKARLAQERLTHLCRRGGGIFLGNNAERQRQIGIESLEKSQIRSLLDDGGLVKVRIRCSPRIYQFFRESNNRYPPEQIRLSGPLPGDDWSVPAGRTLKPLADDLTHPYPVELLLPSWTVESNDFTGWLFGFGNKIRIDAPESLREKHHEYGAGIAGLYDDPRPEDQPTPE